MSPSDFVPLSDSIIEATRLLKEFDISILANHFVPTKNKSVEYEKALMAIENLSDEANFHFDVCPFSTTLMPLHSFLPLWIQKDGQDSILPNIKDEWMFPRIVKDMPLIDEDNFVVAHAPGNDFLVGRTLRDIKEMYEVKDAREALLHFMVAMELRGAAFYKNIDEDLLRKAILSKRSLIASDAPSFDAAKRGIQLKSERTTDTFLKFLSLVEKEGIMPLDAAIRKITQIPAQKFGLSGRGEIKEGNFADLVCFRDANVKFTVVNGRVAVKDGAFQNIFAGHALRHI